MIGVGKSEDGGISRGDSLDATCSCIGSSFSVETLSGFPLWSCA